MGKVECCDCSLIVPRAAAEFPPFRYAPLRQFSDIYPDLSVLGDFFDCTFLDNSTTVGLNEATIRKYIEDQEKHDIALDKLSVKEYEDPFKGSK